MFVVTAIVLFKPEWGHEPLVAHWMLDFDGEGSQREIEVELVRDSGSAQRAQQGAPEEQGECLGRAHGAGVFLGLWERASKG